MAFIPPALVCATADKRIFSVSWQFGEDQGGSFGED